MLFHVRYGASEAAAAQRLRKKFKNAPQLHLSTAIADEKCVFVAFVCPVVRPPLMLMKQHGCGTGLTIILDLVIALLGGLPDLTPSNALRRSFPLRSEPGRWCATTLSIWTRLALFGDRPGLCLRHSNSRMRPAPRRCVFCPPARPLNPKRPLEKRAVGTGTGEVQAGGLPLPHAHTPSPTSSNFSPRHKALATGSSTPCTSAVPRRRNKRPTLTPHLLDLLHTEHMHDLTHSLASWQHNASTNDWVYDCCCCACWCCWRIICGKTSSVLLNA